MSHNDIMTFIHLLWKLPYPTLTNTQVIQTKTKQINCGTDIMNQMNLEHIYKTLYPNTKEYMFSTSHRTFPKLTTYSDTKEISTDSRNLKLYSTTNESRPQQQQKQQEVYKYIKIEQLSTEVKTDQDRNE